MSARYLVTGAAGFIAHRVCEMLLEAGHSVAGLDNLNDAYPVCLKQWRLDRLMQRPGFHFRQVDISHREALEAAWNDLGPFDGVINLAARAGVRQSLEDPWVYMDTNATGTLNLLELCRKNGISKLVLASTSSLYGADNPMPFREDAHTSRPISPYAASKKAAEVMCHAYHHLYGLDITVLRYFTVYGPAGRPDMSAFRFVQGISEGRPITVFGDGRQSRDFTYVDDISRGTIAALRPLGYETINLGSDGPVVLIDMIHMIEEELGCKADIRFEDAHKADVPATWADITRARNLLEWEPKTSCREGISQLVRWYTENSAWAREIRAA